MIITGQQKIKLRKWKAGILPETAMLVFLASRVNEIPTDYWDSYADALDWCLENAIVKTNVHHSINFYARLPHSRLENRRILKRSGVIRHG
jgi:hypothetical protein